MNNTGIGINVRLGRPRAAGLAYVGRMSVPNARREY